jgi:geranylgeranyl pyrophosphate synthase
MLAIYTLQHANESDKKRLLGILKMHTRDKELIKEAIAIMTKYGAKAYSEGLQKKIMEEAWAKIEGKLKPSAAKERLKQMTEFLISRNK